jgi:hypothetical protein
MKKSLLFLAAFIISTIVSEAQICFQKTYGGPFFEMASCVRQTSDGGYIVVGNAPATSGNGKDICLIKTNEYGIEQWTKKIGEIYDEAGSCVRQTTDGGYIISGTIFNDISGFSLQYYFVKTNANGDTVWTRKYGFGQKGATSIYQTIDGGYVFTGVSVDNSQHCVGKLNSNGDLLFEKYYGFLSTISSSIQQTTDGNLIISGSKGLDFCLVKLDGIGDTLWTRIYGNTDHEYGSFVQQTSDGGFIIAGRKLCDTLSDKTYIVKTDSNGDTIWTKSYQGVCGGGPHCVQQTSDGGYIIGDISCTYWQDTLYLRTVKMNSNGDSLWTNTFGGSIYYGIGCFVQQTTDGGYIISGSTSILGAGNTDFILIKTNDNGIVGVHNDLSEIDSAIIEVFPNPANDFINIKSNTEINNITILNLEGRKMFSKQLSRTTETIDIKVLNEGVYFVQLQLKDNTIVTKKFVVIRN